jgi:ankyrin repeat protein
MLVLRLRLSNRAGPGQAGRQGPVFGSLVAQLVVAAEKGDVETIDALVKKGIDVNAKGRYDVTPLLRSLLAKNKDGFDRLLKHGADPNILDDRGAAVMNEAAKEEDSYWLAQALKHKGNPNLVNAGNRNSPGETPIFYAITNQRTENAKLLIAAKADLNHKNKGQLPIDKGGATAGVPNRLCST